MPKTMATVSIALFVGTLLLWGRTEAETPAAPGHDNTAARALLKAADEGLTALNREIDVGNVALTPDLMGRWSQWIRRVYDASVLADRTPAGRLKAAEEHLHRAEDMGKRLALVRTEGDLPPVLRKEVEYDVAAAEFEIARTKGEIAGH